MPEKAKGIWTWYQRRLKETRCDAGKDQEIRTWCWSRLKEKGASPGEYRKIQERKDHVWATIREEILSRRVSENTRQMGDRIRVSTGESKTKRIVSGWVLDKRSYLGEYRKGVEFEWVSKNPRQKGSYPGEYWRRVKSRRVLGKVEFPEQVLKNPKKLAKHNNTKKESVFPSMNMRTPLNDSNKQEIKHLNHERRRGMP